MDGQVSLDPANHYVLGTMHESVVPGLHVSDIP